MTKEQSIVEAVKERLSAVRDGTDLLEVYGIEWCLDGASAFRSDLSALLAAMPAASEQERTEERKFYRSEWPDAKLLEARDSGLLTDDGEAWRYRYTHKDGKGEYDLLYRPLPAQACHAAKSVGANDPQDCDWPFCGCDPYANKVIAALEESGRMTSAPTNQDKLTRLELLERVNELNIKSLRDERNCRYWTVTVLYNTVIYSHCSEEGTKVHEIIEGVLK